MVVISAEALLDQDRTPGWLLTTLTGGRLKASTTLIQQLLDTRGADLRSIVLDPAGQIVGVGHRHYVPPRWLREAIWARDLTDTAPGSTTAVRRCDLDHLTAWPAGPTNVDNLAPTGRTAHRHKTARRWNTRHARDGTTTWTHRATGLTITRPPTWTPLEHPPKPPPPPVLPGLQHLQPPDP